MKEAMDVPVLSGLFTAVLLIGGAAITLTGALGLLRLRTFYERVHAATLGTTLGAACVAAASMIYFSTLGSRLVLHELLIMAFVTVTTPISLIVLVGAAVSRERSENNGALAGRAENEHR
jgi:multicomponent K+:H+ antiporter subunit G